jgi:protein O-GlcNAc transferase
MHSESDGRPSVARPATRSKYPVNAPCPCGSGKKYKRCCGGPAVSRSAGSTSAPELDAAQRIHNIFQCALSHQRQGQATDAEALYAQILSEQPRHSGALHMLGALSLQQGDAQRACSLLEKSIEIYPSQATVHADLGNALQLLGRVPEALASYDRAIELQPELFEAHFNKAVALQQQRHLNEALDCYERVLRLRPTWVIALFNHAVLLTDMQRAPEAMAAYDRCLQVDPNHSEALNNRGIILLHLERPVEALESFDASLRLQPEAPRVLNNRGNALLRLDRLEEAVGSFDRALALDPQFFEALLNRGTTLRRLSSPDAALVSLEAALLLRPDDANTLLAHAQVLADLERHTDATSSLVTLLRVAPATDYVQGLRFYLQSIVCDWEGYEDNVRGLVTSVTLGRRAIDPFSLLAAADSAATQAACARTYVSDKFSATPAPLWNGKLYRHGKIRVAYVCDDFCSSALSSSLVGVWENHDRERFQTLAISLRPAEDSQFGKRVVAAFDEFLDVSESSSADIAALILARETDVLIDLMGFTAGSRPEIFACRPAPAQVSCLGFPGTSGAPYMDYIMADEFLIPEQTRRHFTEQVVWLPDCFQPANGAGGSGSRIPTRREQSLPDDGFVFCCFNETYKLNPTCFEIWMRLLRAVPGSVLWLLADNEAAEENLREYARHHAIDPRRLVFAGRIPHADHLARLQCADLFLDTLPFNAGPIASDVLWAALPILTCAGEAFAARMTASLLRTAGLPELVTHDLRDYESRAVELAMAPTLLTDLRSRLALGRNTSPLFDSRRYCRHLELAYVSMWERSECGVPPEHFAVAGLPHGTVSAS